MARTILIVNEDPDAVALTEPSLSRLNLDITTESALSGEQALERLEAGGQLPSLVLLDLRMPGMCGIETLRRIRGSERLKHLPVVIVTFSMLEKDEEAARRAGADGFVCRSIRIEEFSRDLERQVRLHTGA